MTHFLQRTALILLGGTALCAAPLAEAAHLQPSHAMRLPAADPADSIAAAGDEGAPQLILAAHHSRHHGRRARGPAATYTVRKGDTLAEIADKLGVTVSELKAANGLRRNAIQPGETLKNPKAEPPAARQPEARGASRRHGRGATDAEAESAPDSYKVKRGDTLFSIARRFHTSEADLRSENGLSKRAQLRAGQTLRLPGAGGEGAAASRANRDEEPDMRPAGGRASPGRLVDVEGPARTYRVRRGDNVEKAADRLGVSVENLIRANHLRRPYRLRAGQVLRGEASSAKAYVVAPGDTLADIARRFGVSERALRGANGLGRHSRVAPGRKLRLPPGYRDHGAGAGRLPVIEELTPRPRYRPPAPLPQPATPEAPSAAEPAPPLPSAPQPYAPSGRPPVRTYAPPSRPYAPAPSASGGVFGAPSQTPTPSDAQLSQMGRGLFVWPIQGELISGFGPKPGGQRNDGINIRASAGDPVRAAAAGDVVYAGDQVPGFGNLVLIKHADGWVTAYGHLGRVNVRMQQKVTQGQEIGQAGSTGGVSEPQLHFEVRYAPTPQERAKPIDPSLVLPH